MATARGTKGQHIPAGFPAEQSADNPVPLSILKSRGVARRSEVLITAEVAVNMTYKYPSGEAKIAVFASKESS